MLIGIYYQTWERAKRSTIQVTIMYVDWYFKETVSVKWAADIKAHDTVQGMY